MFTTNVFNGRHILDLFIAFKFIRRKDIKVCIYEVSPIYDAHTEQRCGNSIGVIFRPNYSNEVIWSENNFVKIIIMILQLHMIAILVLQSF